MEANNKQREALERVLDAVKHLSKTHNDDLPEDVRAVLGRIAFDANDALTSPPRNCDVGSPQEQAKRFDAFVRDRRGDLNCTGKCPAHNGVDFGVVDCVLQWVQMPYEANEKGEADGGKQ